MGIVAIDVLMPVDVFWEVRELLKKADFMVATGTDSAELNDQYHLIFKKLAPFAVLDKDRNWLYARFTKE